MPVNFKPLNEKKVFEQVIELLKEKIFSGELQPGDQLPPERTMAEILQVSRLPVREAYKALSFLGVLEIRRGATGGAFIQIPPREVIFESISNFFRIQGITLEEWVEARLHLELTIAKLAVNRANEKDCKRLEDCIQSAFIKVENGIPAHEENIQFHTTLAEVTQNRIVHISYCPLMEVQLSTLKLLSNDLDQSRLVAKDHMELLSLLKQRNTEKLLEAMEEHVLGANARLTRLAERSPLFSNTPRERYFD